MTDITSGPSPGQIAFEALAEHDDLIFVTWEELPSAQQLAWEEAAQAVLQARDDKEI